MNRTEQELFELIEEQKATIESKTQKIHRLQEQIAAYETRHGECLIKYGDEKDLYEGEIADTVLEILNDSIDRDAPYSRRNVIVKSIINANKYTGEKKRRKEAIKRILSPKKRISDRDISELKTSCGMSLTRKSGHYKLRFLGDDRFFTTIGFSPSDVRAYRNNISNIYRNMF
jgi:hypothetical protein